MTDTIKADVDLANLPSPRLSNLGEEARSYLNKVLDYQLDYNIHVFDGISQVRQKVAKGNALHGTTKPTFTSVMHDRLLELLHQERARRTQLKNNVEYPLLPELNKRELLHSEAFVKFAVLQGIEYEFEEFLSDDDLVIDFADSPDLTTNIDYKGGEINEEDVNAILDTNIIKVMIPLAAQYTLTRSNKDPIPEAMTKLKN